MVIHVCELLESHLFRPKLEILETRTDNGMTPLHVGCMKGSVESIKTLLELGADLFAKRSDGAEGIHVATENSKFDGQFLIFVLTWSLICIFPY
jgi:ankyrin repeat protein